MNIPGGGEPPPEEEVFGGSKIEDVIKGEKLWDESGGLSRVMKTGVRIYDGSVIQIHPSGISLPFKVTAEHKVLVLRGNKACWKQAKDVEKGDYVAFPIFKTDDLDIYELNPLNGETRSSYTSPPYSHLVGLTTDGAHLWAVDHNANTINKFDIAAITGIEEMNVNQPTNGFQLMQNYPNPFNPSTKIRFTLPEPIEVRIEIYNTLGQKMKVLLAELLKAGDHEFEFSAENLPVGIYFYRIDAGKFRDVKKMILIK